MVVAQVINREAPAWQAWLPEAVVLIILTYIWLRTFYVAYRQSASATYLLLIALLPAIGIPAYWLRVWWSNTLDRRQARHSDTTAAQQRAPD